MLLPSSAALALLLVGATPACALRAHVGATPACALRAPTLQVSRRAALLGAAAAQFAGIRPADAAYDGSAQERLVEARARIAADEDKMRKAREDAVKARADLAALERAAAEAAADRGATYAERERAEADARAAAESAAAAERAAASDRAAQARAEAIRAAKERESVLERAEKGTLRTPPVLFRARADQLVDPAQASDCRQLDNLLLTDEQAPLQLALYELLPAARQYVRFNELTQDNLDKGGRAVLKRMLNDADVAQERITRQLELLRAERKKRFCSELR